MKVQKRSSVISFLFNNEIRLLCIKTCDSCITRFTHVEY